MSPKFGPCDIVHLVVEASSNSGSRDREITEARWHRDTYQYQVEGRPEWFLESELTMVQSEGPPVWDIAQTKARLGYPGSKAGRADYIWSPLNNLHLAHHSLLIEALKALEEKREREAQPKVGDQALVDLARDTIVVADGLLRDPTKYWLTGGMATWNVMLAQWKRAMGS